MALPSQTQTDGSVLRRRTLALVALGIVAAVLLVLLYLGAVGTAWGQKADNAAIAGAENRPASAVARSGAILDTVSVLSLAAAGGLLCLIGLVRGGLRLGIAAGIAILGANVATQILKTQILSRPQLEGVGNDLGWGNSFPSGHATVAASLVIAAALVFPARSRIVAVLAAGAYAIGIGIATVIEGWHRPSDVIAALLVATGIGAVTAAAVLQSRRASGPDRLWDPSLAARRAPLWRKAERAGIVLLAIALVATLAAIGATSYDDLNARRLTATYFAAAAAIIASALCLGAALLGALSGIDLAAHDRQRGD